MVGAPVIVKSALKHACIRYVCSAIVALARPGAAGMHAVQKHVQKHHAQAFPDGELEGAVLHWALAGRASAPWQRPPAGWATDPVATSDAGVHAV